MRQGGRAPSRSSVQARLDVLLAARPVHFARSVLAGYGSAGGGLLAAGLAYSALFALVPGVLLILGIAGVVLGDGRLHDAFVRNVVAVLPPLRDLLGPAVDELSTRAGSTTILGALGLAWGASRFYDAFESAMAHVFGGVSRRTFIRRTVLGLLAVAVLGAAFGLVTILAGLRAFLDAAAGPGDRPLAGLAGLLIDLVGPLVTVGAIALVYRMVPPRRPGWRAIVVPSTAVTAVLVVITRLFVFLAPRLIGVATVLGTVATVFAALAWLGITFQAVLFGAAWVDAADRESSEATITGS